MTMLLSQESLPIPLGKDHYTSKIDGLLIVCQISWTSCYARFVSFITSICLFYPRYHSRASFGAGSQLHRAVFGRSGWACSAGVLNKVFFMFVSSHFSVWHILI